MKEAVWHQAVPAAKPGRYETYAAVGREDTWRIGPAAPANSRRIGYLPKAKSGMLELLW